MNEQDIEMKGKDNTLSKFRAVFADIRKHFRLNSSLHDCPGFQNPLPSGFVLLKNRLSYSQQISLARKCLQEYAFYPHNNLSALGEDVTSLTQTEFMKKLRWSCLGYNYDWSKRCYVEGWKTEFPSDLSQLSMELLLQANFKEEYKPEAAIVNFYSPTQMMGPHRDDAEFTMVKPIVSISLGCDAIFCIETKPFAEDSEMTSILVQSGDVLIMGGESRPAYHGVPITFMNSYYSQETSGNEQDKAIEEILKNMRININVRQVENSSVFEQTFAGRQMAKNMLQLESTSSSLT